MPSQWSHKSAPLLSWAFTRFLSALLLKREIWTGYFKEAGEMIRNISFIRIFVVTENNYVFLGIRDLIERTQCFKSCLYTITQSCSMPETVAYSKSRTFDIIISDNYYFRITALQRKIKNTLILPANYDLLTYLRCFDSLQDDTKVNAQRVIKKLSLKENLLFSLFSSGLHDDNISTALHISKKTVSAHRRNILGKLKLKNRNELYLFALASRGESKWRSGQCFW